MKTRFVVEVTMEKKVYMTIYQQEGGAEPIHVEIVFDAGDAMQLSYLLEAAAVEIQTRETGARPS